MPNSVQKQKLDIKQKEKRSQQILVIALRRMLKNPKAVTGIVILLILVLVAVFAPLIMPYEYAAADVPGRLSPPSFSHLFGTDQLGRDVLSRMMFGGRFSLTIGIASIILAVVLGLIFGSLAGYFGGWVDMIIMRVLDIIQSIPGLLMAICISSVLGPGFWQCIVSVALASLPDYIRMLRATMMSIRGSEYIEAAVSINCSKFRIIAVHVLPNTVSPLIVTATMGIAMAILTASSMSFIGLGVQAPLPEWGAMLSDAKSYIREYPYLVTFPGMAIMITVLAVNMIGDALRDALDPKLKK
jgi:peptide/nickel transport system permease protein